MPIELRCAERVGFRRIQDVIVETDIATFPQGEAEYSIYRGADGVNEDLRIKGINLDSNLAVNSFGIEDTLKPEVSNSTFDPENTTDVYAPKDTKLSTLAKAAYNNSSYSRCAKKQYERQFCPSNSESIQNINLYQLTDFINKYITNESAQRLFESADNGYKVIREEILFSGNSPFRVIYDNPLVDYLDDIQNQAESINSSFYSEILSEKEIKVAFDCAKFRDTGTIDAGVIVKMDLSGCTDSGVAITEVPDARFTNKTNMYDFIDSDDTTFSFYGHRNQASDSSKSSVVFRNQVLDTDFSLVGKEGTKKNTRAASDVRFSDYQLDVYNTNPLTTP